MPAELKGIVADTANFLEHSVGHRNEMPLAAVPLAHRTGTMTAKIGEFIFTDVAVIPSDAHYPARFDVINLSWTSNHFLKFHETITHGRNETNLIAVD